jgi:RND family efflux transporter MFP subunit
MLQAARARVSLARKAFTDTSVRAPFNGVVAERLVTTGDYVTKGMKVAIVVRVNQLRVQLTVPEQAMSSMAPGKPVTFEVDAYPGRQFEGKVKYVSPALQADQRALTVEAIVPNSEGVLKPGLFATARIEQPGRTAGVLVPAASVQTISGTSRVYVVAGDHAEERIVTTGERVGDLVEITTGLKAGERVATRNFAQLADGIKVS